MTPMNAGRREGFEKDLEIAEASYRERLHAALRSHAADGWGLFGVNEHAGYVSENATALLELGETIANLRQRLGFTEPFALHEAFLRYRRDGKGANAPGETKLAQLFLREHFGES
jgi:hypothetical protein